MSTYYEVRIICGVFSESSEFDGDYFTSPFYKRFDIEKEAKVFFAVLQSRSADHRDDGLYDFLQENFGHEEFDVCNLRIDGLFKITEEKLGNG